MYVDFQHWPPCPVTLDADEETEENRRYVDHVERIKRLLFPSSSDSSELIDLSPNLLICISFVEEELFKLHKERNEILRKQSKLFYILEDAVLQDSCNRLRAEINAIDNTPDGIKTFQQWKKKENLISQIIDIVEKRNILFEDMYIERLRNEEEDEEIEQLYELHRRKWSETYDALNAQCTEKYLHPKKKSEACQSLRTKLRISRSSCVIV